MNYYKLLLLGLLFSTSVFAQSLKEKGLFHIERDYAESVIGFLASDAMRGRKAGSNEGKIAGEYLVAALKELKIVPLYEDYMQPFSIFKEDSLSSRYVHADQLPTQDVYAQLNLANVLGMIEGEKKDEYVIVGAHYDHLGVDHRFLSDSIYNGADDNASGVSAVLQLARAFKQSGKKPNRTLIFAFYKFSFFHNNIGCINLLPFLICVATSLNTSCNSDSHSLCEILLDELSSLTKSNTIDKICIVVAFLVLKSSVYCQRKSCCCSCIFTC